MKKKLLILPVVMLGVILGSCSSKKAEQPSPTQPTPNQPTAQTPAAQKPEQTATSANTPAVTGLIPPTNPDRRRQEVAQGRSNPFALIPVPATLIPEPTESNAVPQPSAPSAGSQTNAAPSTPPAVNQPSSVPTTGPLPPTTSVPPAPPEPVLAKQVEVTGLIELGGVTQIIVKAPNEPFSRYVQAGDYIADGQVLVKRVDAYQSPTPVVILEEVGQEVVKEVGETVEASTPDTQASQETSSTLLVSR